MKYPVNVKWFFLLRKLCLYFFLSYNLFEINTFALRALQLSKVLKCFEIYKSTLYTAKYIKVNYKAKYIKVHYTAKYIKVHYTAKYIKVHYILLNI